MRKLFTLLAAMLVVLAAAPTALAAPPTAVITAPATASFGTAVTASGASSTDDGSITAYRWRINGGPVIVQAAPNSSLVLDELPMGRHTLTLVVVDNAAERSAPASAIVIVNDTEPPTAVLRVAPIVSEGNQITLRADESFDVAGDVASYRWVVDGGAPIVTNEETLVIGPFAVGQHTASLTVTDEAGNISPPVQSNFKVIARPVAVLDAPARLSITAPSLVLSAAGSTTGAERLVRYDWTVAGSTFATDSPTLTLPRPGLGRVEIALVVTDDQGNQSQAVAGSVAIVDDQAPVARITGPASVQRNQTIALSASASSDVGGKVSEYRWAVGSRPVIATKTPTVNAAGFSASGQVTIALIVVDDAGNSSTQVTKKVTILPPEIVIGTFQAAQLVAPVGKDAGQISRGKRTLLAGRIFSPDAAKVSATFSLRRGGKTISLAKRTINVSEGGVERLNTTISKATARKLAGLHSAKVRLRLVVDPDGDAPAETTTRTVPFSITT